MKTPKSTKWIIDGTHSEISFKVKHMMISTVTGYFEKFDATASTDGDDFNDADIEVSINVDSINTKNADRDQHLKSDDFFNVASFPEIKFRSAAFENGQLKGELTIRETTKEIILDADFNGIAVDPYGQTKAGFELTGEINRKDYGLQWNAVTEAGNVVVSDTVKLIIDVQLIKQ